MASSGEKDSLPIAKLEKFFAMKGGRGEASYANNSGVQAQVLRIVLPIIEETLDKVQLDLSKVPFQIADLGCSSGSNTIYIMDVMVKHMVKRFKSSGLDLPEFSAFFSDLPSNDFNTLFQLLPPMDDNLGSLEESLVASGSRKYFVAGVPGSFYGRLFATRSIDVFFSSNSLHWLPQLPKSILDNKSTAYNKGNITAHGASEATGNAYKKQWQDGLTSFLEARSKEIKKGGSMFICCLGRTSVDPTDQGEIGRTWLVPFLHVWDDLAHEGLITMETRNNFHIPIYVPNLQEFMEVIEANASFTVNKLEIHNTGSSMEAVINDKLNWAEIGKAYANLCWSILGVFAEAYLSQELSKELYSRLERQTTTKAQELFEKPLLFHIAASLYLA